MGAAELTLEVGARALDDCIVKVPNGRVEHRQRALRLGQRNAGPERSEEGGPVVDKVQQRLRGKGTQ